jgi:RecB family endonuclease NucS
MKKYNTDNIDTIEVYINENEHPQVYQAKLTELIDSGFTEKQAKKFIFETPFVMEVYYTPSVGMFAVESEAVECIDIFNPYTGEVLEENED